MREREREQHTHGTVLHTCTRLPCPSRNYTFCVVLETNRLIFLGISQSLTEHK